MMQGENSHIYECVVFLIFNIYIFNKIYFLFKGV